MKTTIKVAIADDHALFRKGISELIKTFPGFTVIMDVSNGKELISTIEASFAHPDICLLDVNMPEMTGFETLQILKAKWHHIKVLILTMYDNEFSIIRLLKLGANGYLKKDSDLKELHNALLELQHNNYYYSDDIPGSLFFKAKNERTLSITEKEITFLSYCCSDLTYKEIGEKMGVSNRTIEGYRNNLFEKLNINSRTGLAIYALRAGIVPFNE